MDPTKASSAFENMSDSSQDSMEDPTQLRRVAESDDLEDAVEGQEKQAISRQPSDVGQTAEASQSKRHSKKDKETGRQNTQKQSESVEPKVPAPNKGKFYVPERRSIKNSRWEERAEVDKRLNEKLYDLHLSDARKMRRQSRRNKRRAGRSISFEYQQRHGELPQFQPVYRKKNEINKFDRVRFVKKTDIVQESSSSSRNDSLRDTAPAPTVIAPKGTAVSRRRSVDHGQNLQKTNSNNFSSLGNELQVSKGYSAFRRNEQQQQLEQLAPTPPRRYYVNDPAPAKKYVPKHLHVVSQPQQQSPLQTRSDNVGRNGGNQISSVTSSQPQNQAQIPPHSVSSPSQAQSTFLQPQQQQQQQSKPKRYSTKRDQIVNAPSTPMAISIDTSSVLPQTSPLHSPVQVVPVPVPTPPYRLNNPLPATSPPLYGSFNYPPYMLGDMSSPYLVPSAAPIYPSPPFSVVSQSYQYNYGAYPYFQAPVYDYGPNNDEGALLNSGWVSEGGTVYYPLSPQLTQQQFRKQQNEEHVDTNEYVASAFQETNQRSAPRASDEKEIAVGSNSTSSNAEVASLSPQNQASPSSTLPDSSSILPAPSSTATVTATATTTDPSPSPSIATSSPSNPAPMSSITAKMNSLPQRTFKKTHWVPRAGVSSDSSETAYRNSLSNGTPQ
jgi:hypothetical protein